MSRAKQHPARWRAAFRAMTSRAARRFPLHCYLLTPITRSSSRRDRPQKTIYVRPAHRDRSTPRPIDRQGPSAAGAFDARQRSLGQPSSLPDSSPLSSGLIFPRRAAQPRCLRRRCRARTQRWGITRSSPCTQGATATPRARRRAQVVLSGTQYTRCVADRCWASTPAHRSCAVAREARRQQQGKDLGPDEWGSYPRPGSSSAARRHPPPTCQQQQTTDGRRPKSRSFWGFGKTNGRDPFHHDLEKRVSLLTDDE